MPRRDAPLLRGVRLTTAVDLVGIGRITVEHPLRRFTSLRGPYRLDGRKPLIELGAALVRHDLETLLHGTAPTECIACGHGAWAVEETPSGRSVLCLHCERVLA